FTSGYGARWGTTHWGIDIANSIGTPILAAADGVVEEAGPASGFGMLVRILHADGTTTLYGHINRALVEQGEQVRAGDEIAEMGNRGQSTGPHLHFEVWNADGEKINPLTWLHQHGLDL
ncbi:MAG: M23 family metallopeptidase, partial [Pseudonocardiaceae bacterium]